MTEMNLATILSQAGLLVPDDASEEDILDMAGDQQLSCPHEYSLFDAMADFGCYPSCREHWAEALAWLKKEREAVEQARINKMGASANCAMNIYPKEKRFG